MPARWPKHLQTDHTTWRVTAAEAREVIAQLPEVYDEPFADSSQIPTLLLSRLTRAQVTVALSGDGGRRVVWGLPALSRLPPSVGSPEMAAGDFAAAWQATRSSTPLALMAPGRWAGKLRRRARLLDVGDALEMYAVHNAHWRHAEEVVSR